MKLQWQVTTPADGTRQKLDIVSRRMEGKRPDDDLFPEWPAPKKEGIP
jgi:hypothetical protein